MSRRTPRRHSELLAARRRKLEALRAAGVDPFPHAFPGVAPIAEVKAPHEDLERRRGDRRRASASPAAWPRAAARARRRSSTSSTAPGASSCTRASTCSARSRSTRLLDLDLGDLIGVDGTVVRAPAAASCRCASTTATLLAKSLRPPPEKHHGLTDVETRFRHRELDLIANEEARELFIARAQGRSPRSAASSTSAGFIEVETPVLQPLYGGALARPFTTHHNALDRTLYLRIATELYLKRLIVGGLERVYELGKDFRNEGVSPKHNPEFTMLEWYEAYADYDDVADALRAARRRTSPSARRLRGRARLHAAVAARDAAGRDRATRTGVDILADRDLEALRAAMRERGLEVPEPRRPGRSSSTTCSPSTSSRR